METYEAQVKTIVPQPLAIPDSPSKNSYIGSYYQPPEGITPMPGHLDIGSYYQPPDGITPMPGHLEIGSYYQPPEMMTPMPGHLESTNVPMMDPQTRSPQTPSSIHSAAVANALRNLQRKINQMELEKKQAETNYQQLSHDVTKRQQVSSPSVEPVLPTLSQPGSNSWKREDYSLKLQSVETRCRILEKQLNYMRKMVENGNNERKAVMEKQSLLQNLQPSNSDISSQKEKVERLENKLSKLSRTQELEATKLAVLEEKLLKEERERLLVQEKADQLQNQLGMNLHLPASVPTEEKKTQTPKITKKSSQPCQVALPSVPKHKKMPFVAGKSTSPSHSVHANVQSILHMMKHHQPWLCEQVSALHRPVRAVRRNLQGEFFSQPARKLREADRSAGSLYNLHLALQDELGHMTFEYQDLLGQIDEAENREEREDLKLEMESLVTRMEEKGAQITTVRKHWQMVQRDHEGQVVRKNAIRPPASSPGKLKHNGKKERPIQNNLQLLRETRKFRNNLKEDDIAWEM